MRKQKRTLRLSLILARKIAKVAESQKISMSDAVSRLLSEVITPHAKSFAR